MDVSFKKVWYLIRTDHADQHCGRHFITAGMSSLHRLRTLATIVCAAALLLVGTAPLAACSQELPDTAAANISGYNHTPEYIHQFYVNDSAGGNVYAYGGGGSFVCCIVYPRHWTPGLMAEVRWTTSSSDPKATGDDAIEHWHEATVPIERYDKTGTRLNVHFLPGGQIRLIITNFTAGHPDYPGPPAPERPAGFLFDF